MSLFDSIVIGLLIVHALALFEFRRDHQRLQRRYIDLRGELYDSGALPVPRPRGES